MSKDVCGFTPSVGRLLILHPIGQASRQSGLNMTAVSCSYFKGFFIGEPMTTWKLFVFAIIKMNSGILVRYIVIQICCSIIIDNLLEHRQCFNVPCEWATLCGLIVVVTNVIIWNYTVYVFKCLEKRSATLSVISPWRSCVQVVAGCEKVAADISVCADECIDKHSSHEEKRWAE